MNFFAFSSLLTAFIPLILIVIIISFGKSKIHTIWAFCTLAISIWGFGTYLAATADSPKSALFAWRLAFSGALYISVFFYHTVCIFGNLSRKKTLFFVYAQAIFFHILTITTVKVFTNWHILFNSLYYNKATIAYYLTATGWLIVVFLGHYELWQIYKKSSGFKRIQTTYLLSGFFTGFVGGFLCLSPAVGINLYPCTSSSGALYAVISTYAILKYRILDVKVAITRGAIFSLVYTLVLGIPFGFAGWGRTWLINRLGQSWIWAPMLILLFFATSGPFIYMYLQRKALNRILSEEKHAHNLLLKTSQGMTQVRNLKKLLGLIVHFIPKILKTTNAQIFLLDESSNLYSLKATRFLKNSSILNLDSNAALINYLQTKREPLVAEEITSLVSTNEKFSKMVNQMSRLNAYVIIPCLIDEKLLGFLALGDKKSGRIYTQDDLNVLSTLANQAALAIQNAQFFEEVKKTQEQLYQAEKMATIGTMADGLSHQINNRFNALSLIAGDTSDTLKLLDKNNLTPDLKNTLEQVQNALKRIEDNVKSGGEVVRGLLKYSRPGQEGLELTSLDDAINASLDMAKYKVKLSEIDIIKNYDPDLQKIKMNATQIQEVFFNLIDNAYFAIKQRKEELKEEGFKGEIDINAEQSGGKLKIQVSDNGMGVRKEDFEKLFTPFFTTKASSKKGTGLGLFVIQKIITDNHKGKISVQSNYKQGTTFTIELPIN